MFPGRITEKISFNLRSLKLYSKLFSFPFVLQVIATDDDSGDNGVVTYSIISAEARRMFDIDSTTGMKTVPLNSSPQIFRHSS